MLRHERGNPVLRLGASMAAGLTILTVGLTAAPAAAESTELKLSTGEVIQVEILKVTAEAITCTHPVLGQMTLSLKDVELPAEALVNESAMATAASSHSATFHERSEAASESTTVAAMSSMQDETEIPEADMEPTWSANLVVAAGLATGNTENGTFTSLFRAQRDSESMTTKFNAGYYFGQSNGDRSENRFTVAARNDWKTDSKWIYFADGRYDYDEFQSWEHRISAHGGIGYRLVEKDNYTLTLRGGAGVIKEFNSPNDDVRPELLAGFDGSWQISEKQSLDFSATVYPDLEETGEWRSVSNLGWSLLLDEETNLSLSAGLEHEYQSRVGSGQDHNDLRLFAGLQIDF